MVKRTYDDLGNQNFLHIFKRRESWTDHRDEKRDDFEEAEMEVEFKGSRRRKTGNTLRPTTCQQLANIIGGEVITTTPACVVQRLRNINATILGRRTRSPLALPFALSFENKRNGKTLNLGESVVLEDEINPLLTALRKRGIIVTAIHNHWLFDNPRLMYMHWENIGDPFEFAKNSIDAAKEAGLFK